METITKKNVIVERTKMRFPRLNNRTAYVDKRHLISRQLINIPFVHATALQRTKQSNHVRGDLNVCSLNKSCSTN